MSEQVEKIGEAIEEKEDTVEPITVTVEENSYTNDLPFETAKEEYKAILEFCRSEGKSVPQLIKELYETRQQKRFEELTIQCGGNTQIAQHILELEDNSPKQLNDFDEIKKYFPHIKNSNELPETVLKSAEQKGTLLLDEFLRYLLKEEINSKNAIREQRATEKASTGSLGDRKSNINPEAEEFIRGLWK